MIELEVKFKIWEKRMETGMSLEEVANKVGIGRSTLNKYESGQLMPAVDILLKIAIALSADVRELYEYEITEIT